MVHCLEHSTSHDLNRLVLCSDLRGRGFEIGAGARPTRLLRASQVTYVDRFTYEQAKDGSFVGLEGQTFVDVSIFEAMDDLRSIDDASADFFVANHVIEHVPNVIPAIANVMKKLRPCGKFVMTVPHKEFIFDRDRPTTTLDHFIDDSTKSSPEMLDHYLEYSRLSKRATNWETDGLDMYRRGADFHPHVFTPDSMAALLSYMKEKHQISSFEIFVPKNLSVLVEFYVRIHA